MQERLGAGGRGRRVHRGGADGEGGVVTGRGPPGKEEARAGLATDSCPHGHGAFASREALG